MEHAANRAEMSAERDPAVLSYGLVSGDWPTLDSFRKAQSQEAKRWKQIKSKEVSRVPVTALLAPTTRREREGEHSDVNKMSKAYNRSVVCPFVVTAFRNSNHSPRSSSTRSVTVSIWPDKTRDGPHAQFGTSKISRNGKSKSGGGATSSEHTTASACESDRVESENTRNSGNQRIPQLRLKR